MRPYIRHALIIAMLCLLALTGLLARGSVSGSAQSAPQLTRQQLAQRLLNSKASRYMTSAALAGLHAVASNDRHLAPDRENTDISRATTRSGGFGPPSPSFANIHVNDPGEDTSQIDQTTQSETSVAVSGSNVAIGYNDDQTTLPFLTAASNFNGYSYSTDGGGSFTDGGAVPNAPSYVNLGDPWLASDRAGAMYYSSLAIALLPNRAGIDIGVAKSTNGGRSWSTPTIASASLGDCFGSGDSSFCFYFADKDALTVGPAAGAKAKDVLYDSWDDFPCDQVNCYSGVPVARSSDGGQTWQVSYADKIPSFSVQCDPNTGQCANCTVQQYIGAAPSVDPKDGTLYVAIEKIMQVDTTCSGNVTTQFAEMIFKSTDGGQTFGPGVKIADVTSAVNGLLELAPGKYMRDLELPTVTLTNNALYVAWNDGASGSSHIRLAKSTDGGQTWSLSWATQGSNDELQPALSSDNAGLHLLYYQRNNDNTLDVLVANSQNGNGFVARRVTSVSFPGALTFPNFDPLIAWGYMGDYIANVSDGTHQYFAWGDNRNMVKTVLYPQGRNDPDVYFAKQ